MRKSRMKIHRRQTTQSKNPCPPSRHHEAAASAVLKSRNIKLNSGGNSRHHLTSIARTLRTYFEFSYG